MSRYPTEDIVYLDAPVDAKTIAEEYLDRSIPVVVRGLIDQWPATQNWSFAWFEKEFGNAFINMFSTGNEAQSTPMRLKKMLKRMREGEVLYSGWYLNEWLPAFVDQYPKEGTLLGDPEFNFLLDLPQDVHGDMNVLFIGNEGAGIKNHVDSMGTHLWSAQVVGRKRWIVCSPEQSEYMNGANDWLDYEATTSANPAFAKAKPYDFVLERGEVLFLPVKWWHQTMILDDSVSITNDIVTKSNLTDYLTELDACKQSDPKIARFYTASEDLRSGWVAQLPKKETIEPDRVSNISYEELNEKYLIPHKPVILQNQINDWPALQKWSHDYFKENFPHTYIQHFVKADDRSTRIRMQKYLSTTFDTPHYAMWCLDNYVQVLQEDFGDFSPMLTNQQDWTQDLPSKQRNSLVWIFLGSKGSGIACHTDRLGQHVYSAQIVGKKRWVLHPPEDTPYMYDGAIDLMNPDLAKFPMYAQTSPAFDFVLEPGEVFILPFGWWHQTLMVEDSISLTHDFMNASNLESWMDRMEARHSPTFMKTAEVKELIEAWKERATAQEPRA